MTTNRIGIFGGTFNPVHRGHVETALYFKEKYRLDLLYIIPNLIPPLKEAKTASGADRLNMLNIAFRGIDGTVISDMELNRSGTSYTCDTLREIRSKHKNAKLFLLIGDDWIGSFDQWKNYEYILSETTLVVADRTGRDITDDVARISSFGKGTVSVLGNKLFVCSSSELRKSPKPELLPDEVYDYIKRRGLYAGD